MKKAPNKDPRKLKLGEVINNRIIIKVKNRHKWAKLSGKYLEFNDSFYFGSFKILGKTLFGLYSDNIIYPWVSYNLFKSDPIEMPKNAKYEYISKETIKENYCGPKKRIRKIMDFKSHIPHFFTEKKSYLVYFYWNKTVIYQKPEGYIREKKIKNYKNYYSKILAEYKPLNIFKYTKSALLQIDKHRYVYINDFIYEFSTYDEIIGLDCEEEFPAAYGDTYLYFLLNMKYIPIKYTISDDPYDVYYREGVSVKFFHNRFVKRVKGISIIK